MIEATLGDVLAEAFAVAADLARADDDPWVVIDAAAEMIAIHYRLDLHEVICALVELEADFAEQNDVDDFGTLLDRPWGFSTLGLGVAQHILGHTEADRIPLIHMSYH